MKSTSTPADGCAAGIYTSPILLPLVAHLLESFGALDKLQGFVSDFGRAFYGREVADKKDTVILRKVPMECRRMIDDKYVDGGESVVPFWAGRLIGWEVVGEKE
jgi:dihydroorotase